MKSFAEKSRFRLTMESGICGILLFVGMAFGLSNIFAFALVLAAAFYLLRLTTHLKTRQEPFTRREKAIIFAFGLCFIGSLVLILLFLALRTNAPVLWIAVVLAALTAVACGYASYRQLYVDKT
jgi:putative flippase GtrA